VGPHSGPFLFERSFAADARKCLKLLAFTLANGAALVAHRKTSRPEYDYGHGTGIRTPGVTKGCSDEFLRY
jgi:hypothetical protein